ncbi:putative chromatin remodeling & transcriptional activation HMG family [Rosa chinensis]|uniref:Putative chromatin remodeling & transcriptional activation HMG family n=1 Tax=Rosa chinensis TaxID=74649 RepID=A0A2P6P6E8_ROSCH|nr:high mobility group B protein 6 [Rosa chinensis]PRQ17472.1 putative chromatin remodeling & transcriptional activation HMG family [Rosa chinensis]
MADTAVSEMPNNTRKPRTTRKALKAKTPSTNEANILAGTVSEAAPSPIPTGPGSDPAKENHESLSQPRTSPKKAAKASRKQSKAAKETQSSFEKDLQEMEEKLQALRLEKEKTEEMLKEKEEILKLKEEELEFKGREQDKLHMELKKLQKLKEFKPTMAFPIIPSQKDKKKKGGPEMKRPSPPYVLWCKDQWNQVKQENPEAEFKDISTILGAKWKNVTAEEKKPYEDKYQAEKEAYLQVMAKEKRESEAMHLFEEEHKQKTAMELLEQYMQFKQEAEKDNKKNKKEKDPLKPKQPMSAFFLFTNERRAALNAQNIKSALEVAKITGEEWKNMTEEQKGPYEEMAKKNKERYMQEMEVYKQQKEEEAAICRKEEEEMMKLQKHEAFQLLKKKEKTENIIKKTKEIEKKKKEEKKLADPNKPKRPASSYILFSKEARKNLLEERPGINNSTITALISVKWKELSEEERKVWNDQAAEAMEAYKKELEEYNKSVAASIQD